MSKNGDAFLWTCKELYLKEIHPFDYTKLHTQEYQHIIYLGKEIIKEDGLQNFLGFLMEAQYRVFFWAAYIALEFGNPDRNEILKISGERSIIGSCIDSIQEISQRMPEDYIRKNQEVWLAQIQAKYFG